MLLKIAILGARATYAAHHECDVVEVWESGSVPDMLHDGRQRLPCKLVDPSVNYGHVRHYLHSRFPEYLFLTPSELYKFIIYLFWQRWRLPLAHPDSWRVLPPPVKWPHLLQSQGHCQ